MLSKFKNITFVISALCFIILGGEVTIVAVAITKAQALLKQLNAVANVQLPSSRLVSAADMQHDHIRGVVYEYFHHKNKNNKDRND